MKHHKQLNQCILEAIDYDDNCDCGMNDTSSKTTSSLAKVSLQVKEILRGVTERRCNNFMVYLDA